MESQCVREWNCSDELFSLIVSIALMPSHCVYCFQLRNLEVPGRLHIAMSPGSRLSSGARNKSGLSSADPLGVEAACP